jgi:hypothetical protein
VADDGLLSEDEARALLGGDRFVRLCRGGYLAPCGRRRGRPVFAKGYARFRLAEDLRLHPPQRQPVVVEKGCCRAVAPVARNAAGQAVELFVRQPPTAEEARPLPAAVVEEFQALRRLFGRLYGPAR